MQSVNVDKAALRALIRQRFKNSTIGERSAWSASICWELIKDEHIWGAKYIMAFVPLSDEVNILPLLEVLRTKGKVILLPEVISDSAMLLREYDGGKMVEGMYGTVSPTGRVFTDYEQIDVALVPGVAFTKEGARLGRGKGFYDRFLSNLPQAYKRGVCFPYQIVDALPCEEHDLKVDYV